MNTQIKKKQFWTFCWSWSSELEGAVGILIHVCILLNLVHSANDSQYSTYIHMYNQPVIHSIVCMYIQSASGSQYSTYILIDVSTVMYITNAVLRGYKRNVIAWNALGAEHTWNILPFCFFMSLRCWKLLLVALYQVNRGARIQVLHELYFQLHGWYNIILSYHIVIT